MNAISRREFFKNTVAGAAAAGMLRGNPLGMPIGCQTYPVRNMIAKDFPGTIKVLAEAGFQTIELCSPVGYADSGFGGLAKYKSAELRRILGDAGVKCESSHFDIGELRKDLAGRIAWANDLGLKQMLVPSLDGPRNPAMDDVKRAAEEYNKMGEQSSKAGIRQGLHNEGFELTSVSGKRTYDILIELLDPRFVNFQFQVSTISKGFDAAEYFTKYPGRFMSMHVQDWSSVTKKTMAVGQGTLDWTKIFTAAKTGGLKNYFVEMNLELMKASVPFLRQLQV
ncbi:MAG TPA: sugar phosphate isomerase/epimerase [Bryobacteraceae bacterium]|jgi:sugar phosphate isomerase/epimerase|nr:sugar phosphate isomerase/epimerase [Bryobacteraceae bacterium]